MMKHFLLSAQRSSIGRMVVFGAATVTTGAIVLVAAHAIKISYIIGSWCSFFSATSILVPCSGMVAGVYGSLGMSLLRLVQMMVVAPLRTSTLLLNVIPGFGASMYWSAPRIIMNYVLPLTCIALFVAHPIGAQAAWYSALWLVPLAVGMLHTHAPLFLHALSSTLVAHALGSVIWLYLLPSTPALWLGIIPVVIAERLVMAAGMVITYQLFGRCTSAAKKFFTPDTTAVGE